MRLLLVATACLVTSCSRIDPTGVYKSETGDTLELHSDGSVKFHRTWLFTGDESEGSGKWQIRGTKIAVRGQMLFGPRNDEVRWGLNLEVEPNGDLITPNGPTTERPQSYIKYVRQN